MHVEVSIDRTKKLPDGAIGALQVELQKQPVENVEKCVITVKRAGAEGLSVTGAVTFMDKQRVTAITGITACERILAPTAQLTAKISVCSPARRCWISPHARPCRSVLNTTCQTGADVTWTTTRKQPLTR